MAYKSLEQDPSSNTIMGVKFANRQAFESASQSIGSQMFEGFEPTAKLIEIYRDAKNYDNETLVALIKNAIAA